MDSKGKIRVHLLISGEVQGVFFRAGTGEEARKRGLTGWVRNCPDGSVEGVAEGESQRVEELIEWCRQGPPQARVTEVKIKKLPYQGEFRNFEIRF